MGLNYSGFPNNSMRKVGEVDMKKDLIVRRSITMVEGKPHVETYSEQELIRCKDCKHWYFADNRIPSEQENVCGRNGIVVTPDWFCADGERK